MTSAYAQTFFKNDEKEKTREPNSGRGNQVRVRQLTVKIKHEMPELYLKRKRMNYSALQIALLLNHNLFALFAINLVLVKHFLLDCVY